MGTQHKNSNGRQAGQSSANLTAGQEGATDTVCAGDKRKRSKVLAFSLPHSCWHLASQASSVLYPNLFPRDAQRGQGTTGGKAVFSLHLWQCYVETANQTQAGIWWGGGKYKREREAKISLVLSCKYHGSRGRLGATISQSMAEPHVDPFTGRENEVYQSSAPFQVALQLGPKAGEDRYANN